MFINKNTLLLVAISVITIAVIAFFGIKRFSAKNRIYIDKNYEQSNLNTELHTASDSLILGYGWSENPHIERGTEEAIKMILGKIKKPKFILAFYIAPYRPQQIRDVIYQRFPNVTLAGMECADAVFTPDGIHNSKNGAIAILGFRSKNFDADVFGLPYNKGDSHEAIAQSVIDKTLKNKKDLYENTGLITGQIIFYPEIYCDILNKNFDKNIPMIGGNPINQQIEPASIIANKTVYDKGFLLTYINTNKKIGASFHGGFTGRIKKGTVTKVNKDDNHIIVEIDHHRAIDVYNRWADDKFREYLNIPETRIVNNSVLCPFAKALKLKDGSLHYRTIHPWKFAPDGSIHCGTTFDEGDEIHYVEGTEDVLINRSGVVAKKAMANGKISYNNLAGGVHIYCHGAAVQLGIRSEGQVVKNIVDEINKATKGAPYIGGFFGGEQGVIEGHGFFAANLVSSMMTFSKK